VSQSKAEKRVWALAFTGVYVCVCTCVCACVRVCVRVFACVYCCVSHKQQRHLRMDLRSAVLFLSFPPPPPPPTHTHTHVLSLTSGAKAAKGEKRRHVFCSKREQREEVQWVTAAQAQTAIGPEAERTVR